MLKVIGNSGKIFNVKRDLTNEKFGKLTVIGFNSKIGYMNLWNCLCICGEKTVVYQSNLITRKTKSCGSPACKNIITHGMSRNRIYEVWEQIIQRCTNANHVAYNYYGGRDIKVCDSWLKFENFYKDMGEPPTKKHQIDRIDTNKNYSKDNCRWATISINSHNVRSHEGSISNYKGVTIRCDKKKWIGQIGKDGIHYHLGSYATEKEAAYAYNLKAIELYGNDASLNCLD